MLGQHADLPNQSTQQTTLTGSISGRVVVAESGVPLARVQVTAGGQSTTTDTNGLYTITQLRAGYYRVLVLPQTVSSATTLSISGSPYFPTYYPGVSNAVDAYPVLVRAGEATINIEIPLIRGNRVTGFWGHSPPGGPSGTIEVLDDQMRIITSISGLPSLPRFATPALPDGVYRIRIRGVSETSAGGYFDQRSSFAAAERVELRGAQDYSIGTIGLRSGGRIAGRVTDTAGATVIAAQVTVIDDENTIWSTTFTDSSGNYISGGLLPGAYRLRVESGDHVPQYYANASDLSSATPVTVITNTTTSAIDVVLTPAPRGAIAGRIVDETGQPLNRVTVTIYNCAQQSVIGNPTTNTNGQFTTIGLAAGDYYLRFDSSVTSRVPRVYFNNQLDLTNATPIRVVGGQTITADTTLREAVSFVGDVTDAVTGAPLYNLDVIAWRKTNTGTFTQASTKRVHSSSNGYLLGNLPAGTYKLEFRPDPTSTSAQYQRQFYGGATNLDQAQELTLDWGDQVRINPQLTQGARISGRLLRNDGEKPLFNADVIVYREEQGVLRETARVNTDVAGYYQTYGLPPGIYQLSFAPGRFATAEARDYQRAAYPQPITISSTSDISVSDVQLVRGSAIEGRVIDAIGRSLVRVDVNLLDSAGRVIESTITDQDGAYRLTGLSTGAYRLSFSSERAYVAGGCRIGSQLRYYRDAATLEAATIINVPEAGGITLDDMVLGGELNPGRLSISGRVLGPNDVPLAGASVTAAGMTAVSDAQGLYTLSNLSPGTYTLAASSSGYRFFPRTVILVDQSATNRDFRGSIAAPGACAAGHSFADYSSARSVESFRATRAVGNVTAEMVECRLTVPIARFFGGTLPRSGNRPEAIGAHNSIRVRFDARIPAGATGSAEVRVLLNGIEIGRAKIDATYDSRGHDILIDDEVILRRSDLLATSSEPGYVSGENGRPTPAENTLRIIGPPGTEVAWAVIDVIGALQPIVFVHGWTGGSETFRQFAKWAAGGPSTYTDDIPHWPVEMMDLGRGILSDAETIKRLDETIQRAKRAFGVDQVNLVGHSRGGVIARLVFNEPGFAQQIAGVVTISAPHHGSYGLFGAREVNCRQEEDDEYRENCFQSALQLTPDQMLRKNYGPACREDPEQRGRWLDCREMFAAQERASQEVYVAALSGAQLQFDIAPERATPPWRNSCETHPTPDGIELDRPWYPYGHTVINTEREVYTDTLELLRLAMSGVPPRASYNCPAPQEAQAQASISLPEQVATAEEVQLVRSFEGKLTDSGQVAHEVRLNQGEDAQILLSASAPISLTLRTPTGATLTPSARGPVTYTEARDNGIFFASYTISSAAPGIWQLNLQQQGSAEITYDVRVEVTSSTGLQASSNRLAYQLGNPVTIYARLMDGSTPLRTDVTMKVTVEETGAEEVLRDDGQAGDLTGNDGQFAVTLPSSLSSGYKVFRIRAAWPGGEREQMVVIAVEENLIPITAIGDVVGGAFDAQGRWASLDVPLTLTAPLSGTIMLSGKLRATDGRLIAETTQSTRVTTGTQVVMLQFAGRDIHLARLEGFVQIGDLVAEGMLGNMLIYSASSVTARSTQAYHWREFSGPDVNLSVASGAQFRAASSGQPATLSFSATLSVTSNGGYAIQGELATNDGTLVALSKPFTKTITTDSSVSIAFELPGLTDQGRHPPYILRNITVWRVDGDGAYYFDGVHGEQWGTSLHLPLVRR
jgi:pimeloyl-ACP methyl ester carboxylesterase/protocatechuate 3,4-dioxygenase beta subunit